MKLLQELRTALNQKSVVQNILFTLAILIILYGAYKALFTVQEGKKVGKKTSRKRGKSKKKVKKVKKKIKKSKKNKSNKGKSKKGKSNKSKKGKSKKGKSKKGKSKKGKSKKGGKNKNKGEEEAERIRQEKEEAERIRQEEEEEAERIRQEKEEAERIRQEEEEKVERIRQGEDDFFFNRPKAATDDVIKLVAGGMSVEQAKKKYLEVTTAANTACGTELCLSESTDCLAVPACATKLNAGDIAGLPGTGDAGVDAATCLGSDAFTICLESKRSVALSGAGGGGGGRGGGGGG